MNEYITLAQFKRYQGIDADQADQDWLIRELLEGASRTWDTWTQRRFYPRIETRYYDYREGYQLRLDDDLLAVTTLKTDNGDTTISASDYWPMAGSSYGATPYSRIVLDTTTATPLTYSSTRQRANAVTGIWGYHSDWANAWALATTTTEALDTSETGIDVTAAAGGDWMARGNRFEAGMLLLIGTEYAYVTAVDMPSDELTVIRGVNGSTAAAHDTSASVYAYRPDPGVVQAIRRLTAWMWHQKDNQSFMITGYPEIGIVEAPPGLPADLQRLVARYRRKVL
jgi:hypothetical protein